MIIVIISVVCREELSKDDADTKTPIIVTKLPGLPASFNYVVLAVGQGPGGLKGMDDENQSNENIH